MSTEAQIAANRRNALRSTGPASAKGKATSSKNAIKHGIYSQIAVLSNERQEDYDANTAAFIKKFQPKDEVELRLVERMADCEWRLIRSRYIETASIDLQIEETRELIDERFETIEEPARVAYALQLLDPSQTAAYQNVQLNESRLHRHYERAYKTLRDIRKDAQGDRPCYTSQTQALSTPIPFCASESEAQRGRLGHPSQTQELSMPIPFCTSESEAQSGRLGDPLPTQALSMPIPFCASESETQGARLGDPPQPQALSMLIPFCASESETQRERLGDPPQPQALSTLIPFCASESEAQRDRLGDPPQPQALSTPIPFCASESEAQRDRLGDPPQPQALSTPIPFCASESEPTNEAREKNQENEANFRAAA